MWRANEDRCSFARRLLYRWPTLPLLAALGGCGPGAPDAVPFPGSRVWDSPHIRYHTYDDDDSVCEAVVREAEARFIAARDYLGIDWPADAKVDYYKYPTAEELRANSPCTVGAAACADGTRVHSVARVDQHELIHALGRAVQRNSVPFLNEGLAEVLSCGVAMTIPPLPWRDVAAAEPDEQRRVGLSGAWLIGHLLKRYPRQQFLDWFGRVERGASADQVASAFEAIYGRSLDDMWREVTEVAGDDIQCVLLAECAAPALPLDETEVSIGQGCDGAGQFATLSVAEDTNLLLQQTGFWLGQLSSCEDVPRSLAELGIWNNPTHEAALLPTPAGLYSLGVSGGYPDEHVPVRARALGQMALTEECGSTQPWALTREELGGSTRFTVTLPAGRAGQNWYLRLAIGEEDLIDDVSAGPKLTVDECLGCGDDCKPPRAHVTPRRDDNGVITLRVQRLEDGDRTFVTFPWVPG